MKPSLQKLQNIFKLEASRGYDNRAVVGGLDRILEAWEPEARADNLPEDVIQAVKTRLRDYPRLSANSRAEALDGLWRRLQRGKEPVVSEGFSLAPPRPISAPESQMVQQPLEKDISPPAVQDTAADEGLPQIEVEPELEAEPVPSEAIKPAQKPTPVQAYVPPPQPEGPPAELQAPVTVLSGVGPRHAITLKRLGIETLHDMLYYFPRRYDDYSQLKPINRLWYGEEVTIIATVQGIATRPLRGGRMQVTEALVSDGSGALRITWFNPYQAKRLHTGSHVSLSGKVEQYLGRLVMNNPEVELLDQQQISTNRIVPIYPLTAQITQRWIRKLMYQVVTYWAPRVRDPLPEKVRRSAGLMDIGTAIIQAHFPDSNEKLKSARHRLAFDEIFLLQLGVMSQKRSWQERNARSFETTTDWLKGQILRLPFPLTGAQQRAIEDIRSDLVSGRPMNRLLQGDVGSGKTVVAAMAVAMVAQYGAQSALMAPTSILAEQHYQNLLKVLAREGPNQPVVDADSSPIVAVSQPDPDQSQNQAPVEDQPEAEDHQLPAAEPVPQKPPAPAALRADEIRLMVGATPESDKREIREGLANGAIRLVIGTHALIEEPVIFRDLELTIVDEQHRFGVEQRAALRSKGTNPHLLVMTATPIPRSLALTIYGDLDLSVIDEMPPGRKDVGTFTLTPRERERVYNLIRSQVDQGRQAFIIYPLIQESDNSEARAAVEEHARLQGQVFPKYRLGLLHGRLRPEEKDEVMQRFRAGEIQILVSTSVVEVGVDIPNATVMVIEGANRFGLAQLHQFRGRVGRGGDQAFCILIPDTSDAAENERLQVMTQTNDGFVLAEKDLEQRGPGQFLGTRQSGYSELQMAQLTDVQLIEKARQQAQTLFKQDPDLNQPEHRLLALELKRFWSGQGDIS